MNKFVKEKADGSFELSAFVVSVVYS
jgi:hypothetical protein